MEFIFGILIIWGISWAIGAVFRTGSAASKAAMGKGSFGENMSAQFQGMGPLEFRLRDERIGDDNAGAMAIVVEAKGLIPVSKPTNLGFMTSVIDTTAEQNRPVLATIEAFQESETTAYQFTQEAGTVSPDQGWISWARVGIVFPDILYPPMRGKRDLGIVVRLFDRDRAPAVEGGFGENDQPGMIYVKLLEKEFVHKSSGYLDAAGDRDESRALAIRLAMAVAMADGDLADTEGNIISDWVKKCIASFDDEMREQLKDLYNTALRDAFSDAQEGSLSLSTVTKRLNEIGEMPQKMEAIELCLDVMVADGVAEESEMKTIRNIAQALDIDLDELDRLRDQKVIKLDSNLEQSASIETMIGIDPDWSDDKIKKHIRAEFAKWNSRLSALPEGQEREAAQQMLDRIAEARKKYV